VDDKENLIESKNESAKQKKNVIVNPASIDNFTNVDMDISPIEEEKKIKVENDEKDIQFVGYGKKRPMEDLPITNKIFKKRRKRQKKPSNGNSQPSCDQTLSDSQLFRGFPPSRANCVTICSTTLRIGSLPSGVKESYLADIFDKFGVIDNIQVIPSGLFPITFS